MAEGKKLLSGREPSLVRARGVWRAEAPSLLRAGGPGGTQEDTARGAAAAVALLGELGFVFGETEARQQNAAPPKPYSHPPALGVGAL